MLENRSVCVKSFGFTIRIDEFYFDNYAKDGNSILRPIHYPPIHQSLKMQLELLLTATST
jgi:isopenicillin N synthase-like dioxygenase